jgi:D-beta-D-heptose 7-phosphate kinase/D-beta-D-heptose 1-phosphate adenosyltransferase
MTGPLVVVGDALLDVDVRGDVARTCPDAPAAPVVDVEAVEERAGGAGLAATLAAESTDGVVLVTALCDDDEGRRLRARLASRLDVVALSSDGTTPVKQRVRVGEQTLMRLDRGRRGEVTEVPPEAADALRSAGAVLVADYGRGVTSHPRIRELLAEAASRVPVVWDPHPRGGPPVPGTRVATPNEAEVQAMTGRSGGLDALATGARTLLERWSCSAVAVTRGERGAMLAYDTGMPFVVPGRPAPGLPADTCGAGDRFSSALATALRDGAVMREAVGLAVHVAAEFVAQGAAAGLEREPRPAYDDALAMARSVRAAGGTVVATGGCFDLLHVGHVETLQAARRLGDCLVVCINSDASVSRLKGPERPLVRQADRVRVLEALDCVDAVVVFDEDTPEAVLREIRPHVWCKGGDYAGDRLPEEEALESWGGQAVVLPYVAGRSTTRLVEDGRLARNQEGANR